MPSDFHNFLRYDGKELVCLEIKNSQAFFSLNLLKKENVDLASSIICEELITLIGYSPTLRREEWNHKHLKYDNKWNQKQT